MSPIDDWQEYYQWYDSNQFKAQLNPTIARQSLFNRLQNRFLNWNLSMTLFSSAFFWVVSIILVSCLFCNCFLPKCLTCNALRCEALFRLPFWNLNNLLKRFEKLQHPGQYQFSNEHGSIKWLDYEPDIQELVLIEKIRELLKKEASLN